MASVTHAAAVTWSSNATTTDWFDAANWIRSPSGYPVAGDTVYIGNTTPGGAAMNGTVVIGPNSPAAGGAFYLGYAAGTNGSLTVQQGTSLTGSSINVGIAPGATGDLTVQSGASLNLSSTATLGSLGTGTLNINGGTVSASYAWLGCYTGSVSGTVAGAGTLQITDGGRLTTTDFRSNYVSYVNSGATVIAPSSVLIDGNSSAWYANSTVIIAAGNGASNGSLTVQNGGLLNIDNNLRYNFGLAMGSSPTSTASVTITGPGSTIVSTPGTVVGGNGKASLSILDGASLRTGSAKVDYDYIGQYAPSEGHVTVDGQGSSWVSSGDGLVIGYAGIGTIKISNGGSVTSGDSYLGYSTGTGAPSASYGEVTITGPGSIWTVSSLDMAVFNGAQGIVTLTDGGTLKTIDSDGIRVSYGGPGVINIGAAQGSPAAAPGFLDAANLELATSQGSLVFNHTDTSGGYLFTPNISGSGAIKQIAGVTNLIGNSGEFSGTTSITGGALLVNGILGDASSAVAVSSGGALGGGGAIGGNVTIADGSLNPGNAHYGGEVGTLTIGGNLTLGSSSVLNYNFGQANVVGGTLNDLTVVHGDLTLDGTLNVAPFSGSLDPGVYRVINYDGALTDNGLLLGTLGRTQEFTIQTEIDKQVNLIYGLSPAVFNFWDGDAGPKNNGVIDGGNGTWNTTNDNWTTNTGTPNGPYQNGSFAIFAGQAGTVTVNNSDGQVVSGGMQFVTGGYVIQGNPITLAAGDDIIRVGDGTRLGTGVTATIASELTGAGGLNKSDAGTLILTGANSYTGGTTITSGALQLGNGGTTGSIVGNVVDNGTLVFNRSDYVTISGQISGSGGVIQAGTGTTLLTDADTYSGDTIVLAGRLRAGETGVFNPNSAVTVLPGATLGLHGFSQTVAGLTNAGVVSMGTDTAPGTVLTVNGNYVGQGGVISMNTVLGPGNSPFDKLIINGGTASGNSFVRVINAGGAGGLTTGDGILVVEAMNGATTESGAFALASRLVAGPYEYSLFQGGADASEADNWYLRSTLDCEQNPNADICAPHYRVEASVYTALPSTALLYGRNLLDTLHERVGEERDISGRGDLHEWTPQTGAWGRVFDTHGQQDGGAQGILSSDGPKYDYDFFGLQTGQDLFRRQHAGGGGEHAGFYFAYGHANSTVTHFDGSRGGNEFDAYSLGGYWTHFGQSGWYTDAIIQGSYYDTTSKGGGGLPDFDTHAYGFAASLEGGKPFRFDRDYFIEPQAQISYQILNFASGNDTKADVSFSDADSLIGRIGARFGRDWHFNADRQLTVWLRPNIWREFRGDPITEFSSADGPVPFHADLGGTWGEINVGISGQADRNVTLFANLSCDESFNGNGYAYGGKAGIRFNW